MADPTPLILYSADLTIDDHSLKCLLTNIGLIPDVTTVEVKTMCGSQDYPGSVKWTLHADLIHSFDPEGTNTVLNTIVGAGAPVPFTVVPNSNKPVSATNPEYTGEVVPQPFDQINGDAGDLSSFTIDWSIIGWSLVPTMNITPAAGLGAEATTEETVETTETVEEPAEAPA